MFRIGLALFLTAQLCALVHMGVVRHERCVEHGELVERAHETPHAALLADATETNDALTARDAADDDRHDHCPLLLAPSVPHADHALLAHDVPHVRPLVVAPVVPAAAPPLGRALLLVAPKTSPPVAG